ncbi:MAG TPA: hypothetical protein VMG82_34240 [Candidatus Sulfotelmatobacter sp.]|nr:hypothetical protein [Candidatus Sulfotelmatobacter sp.]
MGADLVGCMGRRSPGRSGGRGAPTPAGPCGRGRWKIGCPGTGRPGAGRIVPAGTLVCAAGAGATGRGGALYTGRGPVCGTIILGAGGCGAADAVGGVGRGAGGVTGITGDAEAAGGGATTAAAGGGGGAAARTGGATTAGAAGAAGGGAGTAGFSVAGATTVGRAGAGDGGAATGVGAAVGAAGFTAGGTIVGFGVAGGGAGFGGGGTAAASFFCVIALSTSPGREMCDRSILVLISSSPRSGRAVRADELCDSAEPRI